MGFLLTASFVGFSWRPSQFFCVHSQFLKLLLRIYGVKPWTVLLNLGSGKLYWLNNRFWLSSNCTLAKAFKTVVTIMLQTIGRTRYIRAQVSSKHRRLSWKTNSGSKIWNIWLLLALSSLSSLASQSVSSQNKNFSLFSSLRNNSVRKNRFPLRRYLIKPKYLFLRDSVK